MAYIGNTPANIFTSLETQTITGDGSTEYTLTHAVSSGKDILVYINNVKQEEGSGKSYTATGNTITFSGAVASSDSCYLLYVNRAIGTHTPADASVDADAIAGSAVVAGKIASSAVTTAKVAADAITGAKIADNAIDSEHYTDGSIDTAHLGDLQVTSAKLDTNIAVSGTLGVTGAVTGTTALFTTAGNETTLTLKSTDADGSSGPLLDLTRDSASPADGDVTGIIRFRADNDAGEVTTTGQIVSLLNDASDGTEDGEVKIETIVAGSAQPRIDILPSETVFNEGSIDIDFRVETDGDTHAIFAEGSTNRVGIGTSSPTAQLHCEGGSVIFKNTGTNVGGTVHHYVNSVSSGAYRVRFDSNDTVVGSIGVGTSSTAFNTSSDYRLKENVTYDFDATTRVKKLKPARFSWIKDKKSDATQDGFIAHEVSDAVPEAVTGTKDAMMALEYQRDDVIPEGKKLGDFKGYSKTEIEPQTLDYSKVVPLLTKALQEALARIETLEAKVTALETK